MKRATPQPSTRTRVFVVKNSDAVATMAESSKIWRLSAFVLVVVATNNARNAVDPQVRRTDQEEAVR